MDDIKTIITKLLLKTNNGSYVWEQKCQGKYHLSLDSAVLNLRKIDDTSYALSIFIVETRRLVKCAKSDCLDQEGKDLLEELYNTVDSLFSQESSILNLLLTELNE